MPASPVASPERRFRVRERVLARRLGEETVLLDLDSGSYFDLDETGSRIWESLAAGEAPAALAAALAREYDAPVERVTADVAALVDELARAGLVVPAG